MDIEYRFLQNDRYRSIRGCIQGVGLSTTGKMLGEFGSSTETVC